MLSPRIRCYFCFVLFLKNRKNTHYFAIGSKSFFFWKLVFFFQSTPSKSIFLLHKGSNQSFSLTEKTLSNLLEDAYFIHTGLFSTTMVFRQGLLFKKISSAAVSKGRSTTDWSNSSWTSSTSQKPWQMSKHLLYISSDMIFEKLKNADEWFPRSIVNFMFQRLFLRRIIARIFLNHSLRGGR